jgi:hypothetical protein
VILRLLACALFRGLFARASGSLPIDAAVPHLLDFLPVCPTSHAAQALGAIAGVSPPFILPRAAFVIDNVLALVRADAAELASPDGDDDREDAVMSDLALLAAVVRAGRFAPDALLALIAALLATDFSEWDGIYDALGALIREIFLSGSPRPAEVLRLLASALAAHRHLTGFLTALLEPIQALIGADPASFVALGASAALLELCASLLAVAPAREEVAAVCALAANIAFADERAAAQCAEIRAGLGVGGAAELEMELAPIVGRRSVPGPDLLARIVAVVQGGEADNAAQMRLFAAALAASADPAFSSVATELTECARQIESRPFRSVYDTIEAGNLNS